MISFLFVAALAPTPPQPWYDLDLMLKEREVIIKNLIFENAKLRKENERLKKILKSASN